MWPQKEFTKRRPEQPINIHWFNILSIEKEYLSLFLTIWRYMYEKLKKSIPSVSFNNMPVLEIVY